jgi:hypothetical protein
MLREVLGYGYPDVARIAAKSETRGSQLPLVRRRAI